ncbi:hypothetical protein B0H13DRAFT_2313075 [Mycena leptocephala]|nr:hypothetical protein B0H13DRAFT_2313075 [Mycena leptocephala]
MYSTGIQPKKGISLDVPRLLRTNQSPRHPIQRAHLTWLLRTMQFTVRHLSAEGEMYCLLVNVQGNQLALTSLDTLELYSRGDATLDPILAHTRHICAAADTVYVKVELEDPNTLKHLFPLFTNASTIDARGCGITGLIVFTLLFDTPEIILGGGFAKGLKLRGGLEADGELLRVDSPLGRWDYFEARYDGTFSAIRERSIRGGSLFRFVATHDYGNLQSGYTQRCDSRMFDILGEVDYASEPAMISKNETSGRHVCVRLRPPTDANCQAAFVYFSQLEVLQNVMSVDLEYYGGIPSESWFDVQAKCSDWVAKDKCFYASTVVDQLNYISTVAQFFLRDPFLEHVESSLKPGPLQALSFVVNRISFAHSVCLAQEGCWFTL